MIGWIIFLLFVALPLAELALLLWIGDHIGFWNTVAIVIVTGFLGAALARVQGVRAWRAVFEAWGSGRVPGPELAAGALFLVGAAFLVTPGVMTDVTGLLLMVPGIRLALARKIVDLFRRRARTHPESVVLRVHRVDPPS